MLSEAGARLWQRTSKARRHKQLWRILPRGRMSLLKITAGFPRKPGMDRQKLNWQKPRRDQTKWLKAIKGKCAQAFVSALPNPLGAMVWALQEILRPAAAQSRWYGGAAG